jgi:uncharacterized protein (DUF2267 family)
MNYHRFIAIFQRATEVPDAPTARKAVRAVLETLSERLMAGLIKSIRAQLPEDLAKDLSPSRPRQSCDADEFLRRVAERADTDNATAERYTKAVFVALSRALEPALFQATWSWAAPRAATALGCESATECSARGPKAAFE